MIRIAKGGIKTRYGYFLEHLFYDGNSNVIVLEKGEVSGMKDVIVRVHSHCISGHVFNGVECDCQLQIDFAQNVIQLEGIGLIIWLDQEGKGNGHYAKILSEKFKNDGYSQEESYRLSGFKEDARTYSAVKKVLDFFNVKSIQLITNHARKKQLIEQEGVLINKIINTPIENENMKFKNNSDLL